MEIPAYQPFYLETTDALRAEISRLGLDLPVDENSALLAQPVKIGHRIIPNRFCAQPLSGCDAGPTGAPGDLTFRRYCRYAKGGFGLIWIESTAAGPSGNPAQLRLHEGTLDTFRSLVEAIRRAAPGDITIILQLASAPATANRPLDDDEIDHRLDELIHAASLAAQAGIDGVDIQCCHGALAGTLLGDLTRSGKYGGAFENRARFLLETLAGIRKGIPGLLLATRICAYDAIRNGFGVSGSDYRKPDLTEPVKLVQQLHRAGLDLLNVTTASPKLGGPSGERALLAHSDTENPDEHPLMTLDRQMKVAQALRKAAPGLAVVGSGFSWLRQFMPKVAAGVIRSKMIDIAGMGRGALAYPDAPAKIISGNDMEPDSCCMVCFACSVLQAERQPVGCVIRDSAVYGPVYRNLRRFDSDRLMAGARRCHICEAAPCISASPTHTNIPAFIKAFLEGDEDKAGEIIREADPLPELTSRLSPAWLQSEGACIETTLTGTPVPILDLQYAISWRARDLGKSGARVPKDPTGKRVAIVGGGPTGIAAAVRLVEHGHIVELFEHSDRLGGTPERVIPRIRLPEIRSELDAVLHPAITAERLRIHTGMTLGKNLALDRLRAGHDAVLIASGLWQESSLGRVPGVVDALSFLESVKLNSPVSIPDRVAILAGGDSAMDAARTVQSLGAREIFIIFGGPRSEMHWHMPEIWFATPGVNAMMNWQPAGFELDTTGSLRGVRIRHAELQVESLLPVKFVIEAMELQVADSVRAALAGLSLGRDGRVQILDGYRTNLDRVYSAGGLVNGGASVAQCVAEGVSAAATMHHDLMIASTTK